MITVKLTDSQLSVNR